LKGAGPARLAFASACKMILGTEDFPQSLL
jgi:hypothetical protein